MSYEGIRQSKNNLTNSHSGQWGDKTSSLLFAPLSMWRCRASQDTVKHFNTTHQCCEL